MKNALLLSAAVLMFSLPAMAEEEGKSGLQPGERPPAYQVLDATGPNEGKKLCYRCKYGAKPVVNIFTRELNDSVANLIKQIDKQVTDNEEKKMRAFVVLLTDDPDKASDQLKAFAKKHGIKNTPLPSFENPSGPGNYKIDKDTSLTIMMWNGMRVKVNHAIKKAEVPEKKLKQVVSDTKKILD